MRAHLARRPAMRAPRHQRCDRKLDEIGPGCDGLGNQAERGGIDHVLGIVEHDEAKARAAARLVDHQRLIEPVEAIGLGGRPLGAVDHQPQPFIPARGGHRRRERCRIVAIAADIEPQPLLRPAFEQVADGGPDHRGLAPGRDQHRHGALGRECLEAGAAAALCARPPACLEPQPQAIDEQIVKGTDEEEHPGKEQQLVLHQRQPMPQIERSDGQGDPLPLRQAKRLACVGRSRNGYGPRCCPR